jgi:DNA-directed RNA polymerase subunit RPC12/RpoP
MKVGLDIKCPHCGRETWGTIYHYFWWWCWCKGECVNCGTRLVVKWRGNKWLWMRFFPPERTDDES